MAKKFRWIANDNVIDILIANLNLIDEITKYSLKITLGLSK